MFQGCFSTRSVGALFKVNDKMKKMDNRDILEENLIQSARNLGTGRRWIFVSKWLADERVNVLLQPFQSPDLNPIENMWVELRKM